MEKKNAISCWICKKEFDILKAKTSCYLESTKYKVWNVQCPNCSEFMRYKTDNV